MGFCQRRPRYFCHTHYVHYFPDLHQLMNVCRTGAFLQTSIRLIPSISFPCDHKRSGHALFGSGQMYVIVK